MRIMYISCIRDFYSVNRRQLGAGFESYTAWDEGRISGVRLCWVVGLIHVGNATVAVGVNGSGFDCSKTPRKLFLSVKKRVRVRLKVRFPQPYFHKLFLFDSDTITKCSVILK